VSPTMCSQSTQLAELACRQIVADATVKAGFLALAVDGLARYRLLSGWAFSPAIRVVPRRNLRPCGRSFFI
jgi:hypothetical protein